MFFCCFSRFFFEDFSGVLKTKGRNENIRHLGLKINRREQKIEETTLS